MKSEVTLFKNKRLFMLLGGGGGGGGDQAYHFGKKDFDLGVGGSGHVPTFGSD